ncbi:hypothetical protein [Nocardia sp. NPDC024068]|uniref:hypothetical protein n=1 Tax=Nocardia sp. NPDC024068 TaxID=3157197 RepID=UPI0033E1CE8D
MTRKHTTSNPATADVVDLAARRRCRAERAGCDPVSVAVQMFADTGEVPGWDFPAYHDTGDDPDGSGWAA